MENAHNLIETLGGRDAVALAVNVQPNAVRMALAAGKLPAAWFDALERLAGQPLPRTLFTFKPAAQS